MFEALKNIFKRKNTNKQTIPNGGQEKFLVSDDCLCAKKSFSIEEIWQTEDKDNFVAAMGLYIAKKCGYGDNMKALSSAEHVFYVVNEVNSEVNNGGFSQFFYNSSGDFSNEMASCMRITGAEATAEICEKALAAVGGKLPKDRDKREEVLDNLPDDAYEKLDECDDKFYDYEDKLIELCYAFVMKNKEQFT